MSPGASRVKTSTASWSARKSEPLTVSNACVSGESSPAFPSAALMPPSAAPEWLRVGWSFEMTATSAPASNASIAARMPAQPAPMTTTSCAVSTTSNLAERACFPPVALRRGPAAATSGSTPSNCSKFCAEERGELPRLGVVGRRRRPRSSAGRGAVASTPGTASGTSKPKTGSTRISTPSSAPESAACSSARVSAIGMRWPPWPAGPPVQPVFTSHTDGRCASSFSCEQPRVHRRRLGQERPAEARREHRRRLGDADLGPGEPGGEAREEVVGRLRLGEPRDRRHDAEGIGGEEDDVRRMPCALGRQRVRDRLEAVGAARVLRLRVAVRGRAARRSSTTTFSSSVPNRRSSRRSPARPRPRGGSSSRSSRPRS